MKEEAFVMSMSKLAEQRARAQREAAIGGFASAQSAKRFEVLDREWWARLGVKTAASPIAH